MGSEQLLQLVPVTIVTHGAVFANATTVFNQSFESLAVFRSTKVLRLEKTDHRKRFVLPALYCANQESPANDDPTFRATSSGTDGDKVFSVEAAN